MQLLFNKSVAWNCNSSSKLSESILKNISIWAQHSKFWLQLDEGETGILQKFHRVCYYAVRVEDQPIKDDFRPYQKPDAACPIPGKDE